ncbi:MAG: chromate transporter [Nitrospirae bacterium]|nr:chromate transporter [Nitrospirota bacterium]
MDKRPTIIQLFLSFLRLGLTAFGGPAMVAYIKELSVKRNKWVDEETFKEGIALCQSIPGATAIQMAAYVGLRTKGITGALLSYIGFGLPAFILMLILSALYERSHDIPQIISLFNGLQVIVVALIANALHSFGKGILRMDV